MMIYIPYPDFYRCAKCFDDRTLTRQCVNILRLLHHYRRNSRYYGLPRRSRDELTSVASMWQDNKQALVQYGMVLAQERLNRGINDAMLIWMAGYRDGTYVQLPKWLVWEPLHRSHRAALLLEGERARVRKTIHKLLAERRRNRPRRTNRRTEEQPYSVSDWIRGEFMNPLSELDFWSLDTLRHRLVLDFSMEMPPNHYREQGFTEEMHTQIAWPYQYTEAEEEHERTTRRNRRTQRRRPRANSSGDSAPISTTDWGEVSPGSPDGMVRERANPVSA